MMAFVPAELTGVWRRDIITTPAGHRDETTQVFWLQTRSWYADLRVRAERPSRPGATSFADYPDAELIQLAASTQGFAGQLSTTKDVCLWRRDVDYQPPSGEPDEATFAIKGEVMIEDGIHSAYQEIWARQPDSRSPLAAFRLTEDSEHPGRPGILVIAGSHFLEIVDRPGPAPRGESLKAIIAAALDEGRRDTAIAALSMRLAYGRIEGGAWTVKLSSLPWLEGGDLFGGEAVSFDPASGALARTGADGRRVWSLIDADPAAPRLVFPNRA
jgi:hypothetical protein